MLSLRLSPQAEKIRQEFERWLVDHPPPAVSAKIPLEDFVEISSAWQRELAAERWVGLHWPEAYGGRGLSIVEEAVVQEILATRQAPQLINIFGLTMVGPVLIAHGSEEQKLRYLPKMLSAEEVWCQGFSEPDAGSDLASLRTTAVSDGKGNWTIQGQKVWTSFAQCADYCFVLVRTDPAAAKHKGLSYFLVPMSSAGITVRPLTQISGDREFNELFFDDVVVPGTQLVGKPGDGWKMAISTLMHERVVLTFSRHLQSESLLRVIAQQISEQDAENTCLARYGELVSESMAVRTLAMSHLLTYTDVCEPGPEGSLDKLGWSEAFQKICVLGLDLLGDQAALEAGPASVLDGYFQHQYLYSRGRTIAAGTSEIQRSIIAERVLGLPRR